MLLYAGMALLLIVCIAIHPATIYFVMNTFDLWPSAEKEGEPVFNDGDFEIRRMPDGSTKGYWSTKD